RSAWTCDDTAGLVEALGAMKTTDGPHFIRMKIAPGSIDNLGRPTVKPPDVARRFRDFIAE
ncbi:MAG: phosphonopyruvate decarboxylase, partial [Rhodospirillaceae bacterium]|nr:phosphonopyruvate decarboxylase [Rhodospirillaceae bacterium]